MNPRYWLFWWQTYGPRRPGRWAETYRKRLNAPFIARCMRLRFRCEDIRDGRVVADSLDLEGLAVYARRAVAEECASLPARRRMLKAWNRPAAWTPPEVTP